jgi:hypothetical protein
MELEKPLDAAYYRDHKRWAEELKAVMEAAKLKRPSWSVGPMAAGLYEYLMKYGDKNIAGINFVGAFTKLFRSYWPCNARRDEDGVRKPGGNIENTRSFLNSRRPKPCRCKSWK